jgi:hypothetical protein
MELVAKAALFLGLVVTKTLAVVQEAAVDLRKTYVDLARPCQKSRFRHQDI